jgi:hypothetical protein
MMNWLFYHCVAFSYISYSSFNSFKYIFSGNRIAIPVLFWLWLQWIIFFSHPFTFKLLLSSEVKRIAMVCTGFQFFLQKFMCWKLGPQCGSIERQWNLLEVGPSGKWLGHWEYCPEVIKGVIMGSWFVLGRVDCYKNNKPAPAHSLDFCLTM